MTPRPVLENPDYKQLYRDTTPTGPKLAWDIGAPQPAVVALAEAGEFAGEVADVGCGLGDNASFLASRGLRVTGLDFSPDAVERARSRAAANGLSPTFEVADATDLHGWENRFDTVLDCALYHCLSQDGRRRYLAALRRAARPGARLHLLCFSDEVPSALMTRHRISETDLRESVGVDWTIQRLERSLYTTSVTQEHLRSAQYDDTAASAFAQLQTDSAGRLVMPAWQVAAVRTGRS